jgi:hypothetical protein
MKQGTTVAIVREHDTPPMKSRNTSMIAGAITSGFEFATEKAFSDTVEDVGGTPKRTVTWLMNAAKTVRFVPIPKEEEITFTEFKRRFLSQEWCEANPDHPISYMRGIIENKGGLVDKIKTLMPMLLLRKGKRVAIVPSGNDEASKTLREKILSIF